MGVHVRRVGTTKTALDNATKAHESAKAANKELATRIKDWRSQSRENRANLKSLRETRSAAEAALADQQAVVDALAAEYQAAKNPTGEP